MTQRYQEKLELELDRRLRRTGIHRQAVIHRHSPRAIAITIDGQEEWISRELVACSVQDNALRKTRKEFQIVDGAVHDLWIYSKTDERIDWTKVAA